MGNTIENTQLSLIFGIGSDKKWKSTSIYIYKI